MRGPGFVVVLVLIALGATGCGSAHRPLERTRPAVVHRSQPADLRVLAREALLRAGEISPRTRAASAPPDKARCTHPSKALSRPAKSSVLLLVDELSIQQIVNVFPDSSLARRRYMQMNSHEAWRCLTSEMPRIILERTGMHSDQVSVETMNIDALGATASAMRITSNVSSAFGLVHAPIDIVLLVVDRAVSTVTISANGSNIEWDQDNAIVGRAVRRLRAALDAQPG